MKLGACDMGSILILVALILVDLPRAFALVQISGVDNVNFGTWTGGNLSDTVSVCIYNDTPPGSYAIKGSGSGPSSSFKLHRAGSSDYIEYDVEWRDSGGSWSDLTANQYSGTFSGASQVLNCGGGSNASIRFSITESVLRSVSAGSYSGSVNFELVAR